MSLEFATLEDAPEEIRESLTPIERDGKTVHIPLQTKQLLEKVKEEASGKHAANEANKSLQERIAEYELKDAEAQKKLDEAKIEADKLKEQELKNTNSHKELMELYGEQWSQKEKDLLAAAEAEKNAKLETQTRLAELEAKIIETEKQSMASQARGLFAEKHGSAATDLLILKRMKAVDGKAVFINSQGDEIAFELDAVKEDLKNDPYFSSMLAAVNSSPGFGQKEKGSYKGVTDTKKLAGLSLDDKTELIRKKLEGK